jgi:dTDP-D-glucose 4,6-dehydratase
MLTIAELIPKSVALLMNGHKVTMYGTGADVKRWLYVSDCSNAFNTILHRGEPNATYNLGSDHASTNYNLCTGIIDAVVSNKGDGTKAGNAEDWINRVPGRGFYDPGIGMDFSALQQLGWTQLVSLDEGVKRTVEWYKENAATWWGDLQKILKI